MTSTTKKSDDSKLPSHIAYHVKKSNSGKNHWTRIGAVWPHADGKGSNLQLELMPLDGFITIRIASEQSE